MKRSRWKATKRLLMGLAVASLASAAGPAAAFPPISSSAIPAAQGFIDDGNGSCQTATPMNGISINETINRPGDIDFFRINVGRGRLTIYTTGSTDTYGTLLDRNCTVIASNDDDSPNLNFKIKDVSVEAGTYYIAVEHYNPNDVGAYSLNYSLVPPPPAADRVGNDCAHAATLLRDPSPSSWGLGGSLESWGDVDVFRLDVSGADVDAARDRALSRCGDDKACKKRVKTLIPNVQFGAILVNETQTASRLTVYDAKCHLITSGAGAVITPTRRSDTFYVGVQHSDLLGTGAYAGWARVLLAPKQ